MFSDYFLRSETGAAMLVALLGAGVGMEVDDVDGPIVVDADGYTTDTIGLIYRPTGESRDSEAGEDPQPIFAAIPGWHVNLRCARPLRAE